jgi:anti-anti-sigma factor
MFKIKTEQYAGWKIVALHGDLDQAGIEVFKKGIEELLAEPGKQYLFDLTNLKFISSEGLNILLWFRFQLEKQGPAKVILTNVSGFIQKIFNITKIDAHFDIQPDREMFFAGLSANNQESARKGQ